MSDSPGAKPDEVKKGSTVSSSKLDQQTPYRISFYSTLMLRQRKKQHMNDCQHTWHIGPLNKLASRYIVRDSQGRRVSRIEVLTEWQCYSLASRLDSQLEGSAAIDEATIFFPVRPNEQFLLSIR